MSGDQYYVGSGPITVGTSELCVLALNSSATRRVQGINALRIGLMGSNLAAAPAYCRISRITNTPSGTSIPTNYGPNPHDPAAPSALTTAKTASTASPGAWTTAPTIGAVAWDLPIPITASYPEWWPLGMEIDMAVSTWLGVFVTVSAGNTTVYTNLVFTE